MNKRKRTIITPRIRLAILIFGVICANILAPPSLKASPLELSLESAILFALSNNPEISIAKEQENQAGFSIDEAKSALYPQIDLRLKAGEEYNDPASFKDPPSENKSNINPSSDANLTVNQLIYDGRSTKEEIKRRQELQTSSGYQRSLVQERIILDTIRAYMSVFRLQHTLNNSIIFIKSLQDIVDKIKLRVEAGAENQAKLKYANSRLSFAQSEYTNTQAALKDAITDLEFLTGELPNFQPKLPDIIDLIQIQLPEYYEFANKHNTKLLLNESDKNALDHQLSSTKGKYLPALNMIIDLNESQDVGGEIGRRRIGSAMVQLTYKIFDGYARDASQNKIKSQIKETEFRKERAKRDLTQKIKLAYNQIKALENEHMTVLDEVEANKDLQALYTEQFTLGEGEIINMIEGEERLFASQNKLHQIENDLTINSFKLLQQIGSLDKNNFCTSC